MEFCEEETMDIRGKFMEHTIELMNVTKTIHKKTVVDSVSLLLSSKEVTGLMGINGSGKTMLMRLITGLIRPTKGTVKIDGKELHKDISFPESCGLLLENPAFVESYSGYGNLELLTSVKGVATKEDIRNTILLVGLNPDDKKKYRKYSLGMKQRLGIAAAVVERPDIVILDEPTNSLDSDGVEMVKEVIKEQKKRGALVILACHDMLILRELSDIIYKIENGVIVGSEEAGKNL